MISRLYLNILCLTPLDWLCIAAIATGIGIGAYWAI